MNTIPWYQSPVFTAGLTAFVMQLATMADAAFLTELLEGKREAYARAIAATLSGIVVAVRVMASAQPLALTQGQADAANTVPSVKFGGNTIRGSRGFARPLALCLLLATAIIAIPILQGCQALGIQPAKTFQQRYAYALSQTSALRVAATQALTSRSISTADAEYVLKLTDESRKLLDNARLVVDAGELAKGQTQLELATTILTQLQAYLTARASK